VLIVDKVKCETCDTEWLPKGETIRSLLSETPNMTKEKKKQLIEKEGMGNEITYHKYRMCNNCDKFVIPVDGECEDCKMPIEKDYYTTYGKEREWRKDLLDLIEYVAIESLPFRGEDILQSPRHPKGEGNRAIGNTDEVWHSRKERIAELRKRFT